jgi:hypothetical protein
MASHGPWPEQVKSPREMYAGTQQILNADWPQRPGNFRHRDPIAVEVRIEWDRDGEEWVPGYADRWNWHYVRVTFNNEPRSVQGLTWVQAADVRRRPPATPGVAP